MKNEATKYICRQDIGNWETRNKEINKSAVEKR